MVTHLKRGYDCMLHLNTHSVYSYKKSIASIDGIIKESKRQGEKSFCITDYGSLTSFVKAFAEAKKNGMKFIPGCEFLIRPDESAYRYAIDEKRAYYRKEMRLKRTTAEMYADYERKIAELDASEAVDYHSLILLAKNDIGFKNLVEIYNTETRQNNDENEPFLASNESIWKRNEGLVALTGGLNGEILYWIRNGNEEKAENLLLKYREAFGDNLYAQLEYQSNKRLDEVNSFNKFINLAKKHGIPFVVTNNVLSVQKRDKAYYRLYSNVMASSRLTFDEDRNYMIEEDELKELMYSVYPKDAVDEGFKNIRKIENEIEEMSIPKAPGLIDSSEELIKLCEDGWKKLRKGTDREEESKQRYLYELSVINGKNFSQYFIKVLNIILTAKDLGILIGPGRGSGCGSEICYLIGITAVDPLKYGLFFERFLNPDRHGFPDIDIDMASVPMGKISADGNENEDEDDTVAESASRNLLVAELIKRGFFEFAGFIQNEVTASALVLFKNLAKYHEIPFHESNRISTDATYSEMLKMKPDKKTKKPWQYDGWLSNACNDFGLEWQDVWEPIHERMQFCYDLAGIPQNTSVAASGVIMADFKTTLPVHDGIIGYNGVDLESCGYIKYDLLSINTLNAIQHFYGLDVDWNDNDDPKVWETFQNGDLDFVFQFAGFIPKDMCKRGKPTSIEHLAEINSINRPGPLNLNLNNIWVDIRNRNYVFEGNGLILSKLLKKRFGESHSGLVIYQEDVMAICQDGAGFSLSEADDIRKAMGKKNDELMDSYRPRFINGWIEVGTDGNPEEIWQMLVDFAKYGFNKSHAVAYSIIGYQTAKIWTYHKEEFLEFMLNYDTKKRYQQALDKCKELGFKFEYPTLSNMAGNKFKVKDGVVYIPGNAEKNYESYVDFLFGDTKDLANLIYKGVCDKLTKDRYALVELVTTLLSKPREAALYMEPNGERYTKLTQILDGLKLCGAVVDWRRESGGIRVFVKRMRGPASEVFFNENGSDNVRLNLIKYDLKMFGSIRNGAISDLPFINTVGIERTLENIKRRYYETGKGHYAYKAMRDELQRYMREYFSNRFRNTFEDVYAVIDDSIAFTKSTKLIVNFNDRQEILYVSGENARRVKQMSKKPLVKMTLVYSPYIARKTESFIYDFDIETIEEITTK